MPRKRKVEPAIVKILRDAWVPQQFKAAKALRREGITAQLFWEFFYRDEGMNKYGLDSAWVNNTYNELRDLEREDKQKADKPSALHFGLNCPKCHKLTIGGHGPEVCQCRKRGRPPVAADIKQRAHSLIQANPTLSISAVARHVGVSGRVVEKWFEEWNLKRWSKQ